MCQRLKIAQVLDGVVCEDESGEVGGGEVKGGGNAADDIVREIQRAKSLQEGEVGQGEDLVICKIYRVVLVLRDTEVFDGRDFAP